MTTDPMPSKESLTKEIQQEVAAHKICIYTKGTKEVPMCGFTIETREFFEKYQVPFEMIDVVHHMEKRQALSEMTNWPTLPKVFINGQFYGDTDILAQMEKAGELQELLRKTFESEPVA